MTGYRANYYVADVGKVSAQVSAPAPARPSARSPRQIFSDFSRVVSPRARISLGRSRYRSFRVSTRLSSVAHPRGIPRNPCGAVISSSEETRALQIILNIRLVKIESYRVMATFHSPKFGLLPVFKWRFDCFNRRDYF